MFAVASFLNSSALFSMPMSRGVITLVSCLIIVSTYRSNSHSLKQFGERVSCFLPLKDIATLSTLRRMKT